MSLVTPRPLPLRDIDQFSEAWLMRRTAFIVWTAFGMCLAATELDREAVTAPDSGAQKGTARPISFALTN